MEYAKVIIYQIIKLSAFVFLELGRFWTVHSEFYNQSSNLLIGLPPYLIMDTRILGFRHSITDWGKALDGCFRNPVSN